MAKPKSRKRSLSLSQQLNAQLKTTLQDMRSICQEVGTNSREELKKTKDVIKRTKEKLQISSDKAADLTEKYQERKSERRPTATAKKRMDDAKARLKKLQKSLAEAIKAQETLKAVMAEVKLLKQHHRAREAALKAFDQEWRAQQKNQETETATVGVSAAETSASAPAKDKAEVPQQLEVDVAPPVVVLDEKIPDTTVCTTADDALSLGQLKGSRVVLYFYPKDNTPGCTKEGEDFRVHYDEFKEHNAVILGVSRDSVTSHQKFKKKLGLPFDLISDGNELLCQQYGVIKMKNSYGKRVRAIERSTFLIDSNGVLRRAWKGVKVAGHAAAVLDSVIELGGENSSGSDEDNNQRNIKAGRKSSLENLLA